MHVQGIERLAQSCMFIKTRAFSFSFSEQRGTIDVTDAIFPTNQGGVSGFSSTDDPRTNHDIKTTVPSTLSSEALTSDTTPLVEVTASSETTLPTYVTKRDSFYSTDDGDMMTIPDYTKGSQLDITSKPALATEHFETHGYDPNTIQYPPTDSRINSTIMMNTETQVTETPSKDDGDMISVGGYTKSPKTTVRSTLSSVALTSETKPLVEVTPSSGTRLPTNVTKRDSFYDTDDDMMTVPGYTKDSQLDITSNPALATEHFETHTYDPNTIQYPSTDSRLNSTFMMNTEIKDTETPSKGNTIHYSSTDSSGKSTSMTNTGTEVTETPSEGGGEFSLSPIHLNTNTISESTDQVISNHPFTKQLETYPNDRSKSTVTTDTLITEPPLTDNDGISFSPTNYNTKTNWEGRDKLTTNQQITNLQTNPQTLSTDIPQNHIPLVTDAFPFTKSNSNITVTTQDSHTFTPDHGKTSISSHDTPSSFTERSTGQQFSAFTPEGQASQNVETNLPLTIQYVYRTIGSSNLTDISYTSVSESVLTPVTKDLDVFTKDTGKNLNESQNSTTHWAVTNIENNPEHRPTITTQEHIDTQSLTPTDERNSSDTQPISTYSTVTLITESANKLTIKMPSEGGEHFSTSATDVNNSADTTITSNVHSISVHPTPPVTFLDVSPHSIADNITEILTPQVLPTVEDNDFNNFTADQRTEASTDSIASDINFSTKSQDTIIPEPTAVTDSTKSYHVTPVNNIEDPARITKSMFTTADYEKETGTASLISLITESMGEKPDSEFADELTQTVSEGFETITPFTTTSDRTEFPITSETNFNSNPKTTVHGTATSEGGQLTSTFQQRPSPVQEHVEETEEYIKNTLSTISGSMTGPPLNGQTSPEGITNTTIGNTESLGSTEPNESQNTVPDESEDTSTSGISQTEAFQTESSGQATNGDLSGMPGRQEKSQGKSGNINTFRHALLTFN